MNIDPMIVWTALGVIIAVIGQIGQFMHLSSKMERRFTALEIHMEYMKAELQQMPKRAKDA